MSRYIIPESYYESPNSSSAYKVDSVNASYEEKQAELLKMLYAQSKTRIKIRNNDTSPEIDKIAYANDLLNKLQDDGSFIDMPVVFENAANAIGLLCDIIINLYHYHFCGTSLADVPQKVITALLRYMRVELDFEDKGPRRFLASCFKVPTCSMNIFMAFLPDMLAVEKEDTNSQTQELYNTICDCMMQAWLLPQRDDETDAHPITVERFRNHVWWVGGNGLSFRAIHYIAICLRDSRMVELLLYVSRQATWSKANHTTETFWNEGLCADWWGWGHGTQICNNGYPTISMLTIMDFMRQLKDTLWDGELSKFCFENMTNIACGPTWNLDGTFFPPIMDRTSFLAPVNNVQKRALMMQGKIDEISKFLLNDLGKYMPENLRNELTQYLAVGSLDFDLTPNRYNGARYFFCNDALVCKNKDRYIFLAMASSRCKGVECDANSCDKRNFFLNDGVQIVERHENAYKKTLGTWNLTHIPGITSRHIEKDMLMEEVNWSGYNSIHNFAAGVAYDNKAVSSFIFEKDRTRYADGGRTIRDEHTKEMMGVLAYKSSFINDNLIVCLGSGVSDKNPEYGSHIRTTVNNTLADNAILDGKEFTGEHITGNTLYAVNDGITYGVYANENQKIELMVEDRQTDWLYYNAQNTNAVNETLPVFEIGINHGEAPVNDTYHYFMYTQTDKTAKEVEATYSVLQNNTEAQLVQFDNYDVIQGVFFVSGDVENEDFWIRSSAPCALMAERVNDKQYKFTVCDARHSEEMLYIKISMKFKNGDVASKVVKLPEGELRGSQVSFVLDF